MSEQAALQRRRGRQSLGKSGPRGVCFCASSSLAFPAGNRLWQSGNARGSPGREQNLKVFNTLCRKNSLGIFFFCYFFSFQVRSWFKRISSSGVPATCSVPVRNRVLKIYFPQLIRGIFSPDAPTSPIPGYFCSRVPRLRYDTAEHRRGQQCGGGRNVVATMPQLSLGWWEAALALLHR